MTTQYLDRAIVAAEEMLLAPCEPESRDTDRLADYVEIVRRPDSDETSQQLRAEQLAHLARLLGALGMKTLSLSIADMALRHMEMVEADHEVYAASVWDDLGSLLAEHGELERSRLVLCRALGRAGRGSALSGRGRILTNLSTVSMRMRRVEDAEIWAGKALREMSESPEDDDPEARLTALWVRLEVVRSRKEFGRIQAVAEEFDTAVERFIRLRGGGHPTAVAARRALATARFQAAAAAHDVERSERELVELEIVKLNAAALLGADHRETIATQAALSVAEFEAASGGSGSLPRRKQAVSLLEMAERMAVRTLGREHIQTLEIRKALARLRRATREADDLPYRIDRTFTPQQNGSRNEAKREAIDAEKHIIRLIAHAGASYFLAKPDLFYWQIYRALARGTVFHVILSSPWNNSAIFMQHVDETEREGYRNIVERVLKSAYYRQTFEPVIDSYLALRERFPDNIELKLTPADISGSTLLTSETGFFEPYITMNPSHRTRRGFSVFEHQFRRDSKYYADSLDAFHLQWELTNSWEQFGDNEEQHKARLLDLMATQSDDQLSKSRLEPAPDADEGFRGRGERRRGRS
ncbi:Tetratricopeptide repeat protein OS=Streptomyces alboniger OX=132473 GN=CP975_12855 PE=4 SV=1 [Streptomyces alboniger]